MPRDMTAATIGFEDQLWRVADVPHFMDATEYKHVVFGPLFLKHISGAIMSMFSLAVFASFHQE